MSSGPVTGVLVPLQAQGGDISFVLMLGAIMLIFYLLVLRPQQKQQKERYTGRCSRQSKRCEW